MSGHNNRGARGVIVIAAMAGAILVTWPGVAQQGDAKRGAQAFRACIACHSLEPSKHLTGPSLAGLFGRKAGSVDSFDRYSPALKSSDVTWDEKSLDAWLANPARFIPGNHMTFPGIRDAHARSDLIAFLQSATTPGTVPAPLAQQDDGMGAGGMGGMMGSGQVLNLKRATPAEQVTSIRYCRDSYHVQTADGEIHDFWERNLRLKTDSSQDGPPKGAPALVGAGMMGDRGDVIFAGPEEIRAMIMRRCG